MTHLITTGVRSGPIRTSRTPGESLHESVRRHRQRVAAAALDGDRLITTWQLPGIQDALATTRRAGESDEDVRRRHLSALPLL